MTTIRMPRLMDRRLQEQARLQPLSLSLTLTTEALSTARMTLGPDAPRVAVQDFIELYDRHGSVGVFRITKVTEELGGTQAVHLEHGLCTLGDGMIPAQSFMQPVREAFGTLLACQPTPRWVLGDVDVPEDMTLIFSTDYMNGLDAMQSMLAMLPEDYAPEFDQSVTPWVLHIRKQSEEVGCEGRIARNLRSVRIEEDGSRLCTRVYPFGAEVEGVRVNLTPIMGLDYTSSAMEDGSDVISRTWHNDRIFDTATLYEVAIRYLERHERPETRVTVDARDLSPTTLTDFDRFSLGKLCRLAIPDMARYLTARIVCIEQEDVYGDPDHLRLTLSDHRRFSRESEEIDELIRQVRAGKLLAVQWRRSSARIAVRAAISPPSSIPSPWRTGPICWTCTFPSPRTPAYAWRSCASTTAIRRQANGRVAPSPPCPI